MLKLTEREYEWVRLYGVMGYNLKEVSVKAGVPYDAVCWHIRQFMQDVGCLSHYGFKQWVKRNINNIEPFLLESRYSMPRLLGTNTAPRDTKPLYSTWTPQAIECYELQGDCKRCTLPPIMGDSPSFECQIPKAVKELLARRGPPSQKLS